MRYCSRCVMPETAETLTFDDQGVCSVCRQIEVQKAAIDWAARGRELDALIADFRGKHDYDCIVPFSGTCLRGAATINVRHLTLSPDTCACAG